MTTAPIRPPAGEEFRRAALAEMLAAPTMRPFSPDAIGFCADLSRALFRAELKDRPEVHALAYWCRPAEVVRLQSGLDTLANGPVMAAPRGTVFHVPPVNVETLFLYGWVLSMLCGNRNIIRISSRASGLTTELCELVGSVMARYEGLARINAAIRYGHDDALTAAFSAACDVRIVWGGDETVRALRAVPLAPAARDICFPDRTSYAAIRAGAFMAATADQKQALAHAFYNDCYWFDQMACSSPRLIAWCGTAGECGPARAEFYELLAAEAKRNGYSAEATVCNDKLLLASRMILDGAVDGYQSYGGALTVLNLASLSGAGREHCGGGLLLSMDVPDLQAIAKVVERRDQTLTYFGFDRKEMEAFAWTLNGKGIDRMVPVGQALTFNRFWDGYDLLGELTRRVWVQ